ncbi:MAG: hypothetical protein PHO18_07410 [Synergistaceae bacterium]|nr:hypothetical protein [Synergistaceae bacterium]
MLKKIRHSGAVLAGVLMLSLTALACSLLTLSSANKVFDTLNWQTMLLKREEAAVQANALAKKWFITEAEKGMILPADEFDPAALPKDDPYIQLPAVLLQQLSLFNKNVDITAEIIDLNYSDKFKPKAEAMEIPFGSPLQLLIQEEGESTDVVCIKGYCLRVAASLHDRPGKKLVITETILAVKDADENINLIPLYTKKQH